MSESKQCSIEGCPRPSSSRGWCSIHYERWRRGAGANASIRPYGTNGICPADGCEKPATHKGWCLLHYARWRRHGDPLVTLRPRYLGALCSVEGCDGPAETRGWCGAHYHRWATHGDPLITNGRIDPKIAKPPEFVVIHVKTCAECGKSFTRSPQFPVAQWDKQRCCSLRCGNALGARGRPKRLGDLDRATRNQHAQRRKMPEWAAWWEEQRRQEDIYDLAARLPVLWQGHRIAQGGPVCHLSQAPRSRRFLCGWCPSCGNAWTYYAKRAQSRYCAECNEAHHKRPANRRARQNGALYEVIIPRVVFERDGYRCQICKRKTRGKFPRPLAPTVDHIIPLAVGGDHVYSNVQCACFSCNCRKQAGSANDQMRLAV